MGETDDLVVLTQGEYNMLVIDLEDARADLAAARAALEVAERRAARLTEALVERDHFPHAHPTQRDYVTCRLCEESAESRDDGAISHKPDCLLAPPSTDAPSGAGEVEGE